AGVGTHPLEGLLGRTEVADPVVDDGDDGPRPVVSCVRATQAGHRVPLVDGTPEPSMRTALRSAWATPLNWASIRWWVFLPRRDVMWSVIDDAITNARQNSSTSWGSKGGSPRIFTPGKSTS